jgi:exosome complex exonuclease DIS3/RRP44
VDPPGCKNIDDVLHCRTLSNRNFEVGVHIADVINFVQSGIVLDNEIVQRATSLAFERRIDILPKVLSEEICSL